jgi:hypothetical protein
MKFCAKVFNFVQMYKILYISIKFCTKVWNFVQRYEILYIGMKFCTKVWTFVSRFEILYKSMTKLCNGKIGFSTWIDPVPGQGGWGPTGRPQKSSGPRRPLQEGGQVSVPWADVMKGVMAIRRTTIRRRTICQTTIHRILIHRKTIFNGQSVKWGNSSNFYNIEPIILLGPWFRPLGASRGRVGLLQVWQNSATSYIRF